MPISHKLTRSFVKSDIKSVSLFINTKSPVNTLAKDKIVDRIELDTAGLKNRQ